MENKNSKLGFIFSLIAVFIVGIAVGSSAMNQTYTANQKVGEDIVSPVSQTVSIMIDDNSGKVKTFDAVPLVANDTLFTVLKRVTDEQKIEFNYKDYGGELGVFVNSINSAKGDRNSYWQFWVNNKYSQKGVSGVVPTAGDVIAFKLTKGQLN